MPAIKTIGLLTSGGDAPGMNAAIRAVTRSAIYNGFKVKGIYRGYKGLVENEIVELKTQNVSNIIHHGGTILKTARCKEFKTEEGRQIAYDNIKKHGIDALVVIGGDGSLRGARQFARENYGVMPTNVVYGIDTNGSIRKQIAAQMKLQNGGQLPLFVIADTFNRVVFFSEGYTIGLGDQLVKVSSKL